MGLARGRPHREQLATAAAALSPRARSSQTEDADVRETIGLDYTVSRAG